MTDEAVPTDRLQAFRAKLLAYHQATAAHRADPSAENMDRMNDAGLALVSMHQVALRGSPLTQVLREVEAERCTQVAAGYDAAHDDGHTLGEIGYAAGYFALPEPWKVEVAPEHSDAMAAAAEIRHSVSWKTGRDRRRKLIICAALAIAEVERLDRVEAGRVP